MTSEISNSDDLETKESRGILEKLNNYFSRNEPILGYGKNTVPVVDNRRMGYNYYDQNLINNQFQNSQIGNINRLNNIGNIDYYDYNSQGINPLVNNIGCVILPKVPLLRT